MNYKHGKSGTKTHTAWCCMRARCTSPNNSDFHNYGERGIMYTSQWQFFHVFLQDMGECPEGYSLERLDSNLHYNKENCKWIPFNEQSHNRRTSLRYTINGETKTLNQWCKIYKQPYARVWARINKLGFSFKDALERKETWK